MVFPQQVSFKEILQAAFLVLWSGLGVQQRGAEAAARHQGRFILSDKLPDKLPDFLLQSPTSIFSQPIFLSNIRTAIFENES